jgi:hypothetical protein
VQLCTLAGASAGKLFATLAKFSRERSLSSLKKVHLVSCNTMMVQSTLQDNNEYLCRDYDDFLKYEQHCSALIIDTLIREMKYETKQYEGLVILDSLPQSEESKYDVHD